MATILGLDIGAHVIRAAVAKTALRKLELVRYLEAPVAAATAEQAGPRADGEQAGTPGSGTPGSGEHGSGEQQHADALRLAISEILGSLERPPDRIVAALDGQEASLRVVEIPAGAAKRAGEVLPFELETLLPFPIEDAVVDYQHIGEVDGQLRLLAAAAPSERVGEWLTDLRDAGAEPRELAVGAAALDGLVPLLELLEQRGPLLLLDVGDEQSDVCILREGRCALARTLSEGLRDAESGRLEASLRRTLASWRASGGDAPTEALLMGSAAANPEAAGWLGSQLDLETRVVPLPPIPGADDQTRGTFGRAAALACRVAGRGKRIDMRQGEFAPKRAMGALVQQARLIGICAAVVLLAFAFSSWARWASLDDENLALKAELERVTEEAFDEGTASPMRARELLERGAGNQDPLPRFDAFDALEAISGNIAADISHDTRRLHIELEDDGFSGRWELQGRVDSVAQRDQVAQALETQECFVELEKGRTTPGPGNEGLNYQLESTIRCPDAPEPEDRRRRRGSD